MKFERYYIGGEQERNAVRLRKNVPSIVASSNAIYMLKNREQKNAQYERVLKIYGIVFKNEAFFDGNTETWTSLTACINVSFTGMNIDFLVN